MVGYDVSDVFVTCTPDQVRQIYINIIEVLQRPTWTLKDIMDAVRVCNPVFAEADKFDETINYYVERIARTEMNRILFYAKEQSAIQDGDINRRFRWTGPLDSRTTPCCRFMQTGELKGMTGGPGDKAKPYDYEFLRDELPEWREDGWPLPELKDAVRQVYAVFHAHDIIRTEMPSEWSMHINCRHTFSPISTIPADSGERPVVVDNWIQPVNVPEPPHPRIVEPEHVPATVTVPESVTMPESSPTYTRPEEGEPMGVQIDGVSVLADMTDSDEVYVEDIDDPLTFGIRFSRHGMPAYYLYRYDTSDDPVYVFESLDEEDIFRYAGMVLAQLESGVSAYDLAWALRDEGLTDSDTNYLMENVQTLYDIASKLNWGYWSG